MRRPRARRLATKTRPAGLGRWAQGTDHGAARDACSAGGWNAFAVAAHANIRSVTSQGSQYSRFQRGLAASLRTGNASIAWTAALEVERIDLQDALALVLLVVGEQRYPRAAARWLGRACMELPITLAQVQLVGAALAGLPDRGAALALEAGCVELGLARAAATTRAAYITSERSS